MPPRRAQNSRTTLLALFAALALALPPAGAEDAPSLAMLLSLSEDHHSEFHVQLTDYQISREAAPIARAGLLPQVGAVYSRRQDGGGNNNGGGGGGGGGGMGGGGDSSSWSAGVSVEQVVYNLPQVKLLEAAEEQEKVAALRLEEARLNLHRDVILAWLQVQLAAETLRLVEARRKTLRAQLARTEALAASGQVIEADVLLARARLASAQSQWEQAKHDLAVAHDEIVRLTGVAITDKRLRLGEDAPLPKLPPLSEWRRKVDTDNLAVKAARGNVLAVRRRLQAATGALQPSISLSGSYTANDSLGDTSHSWQLQLRQPLFSGGNLRAAQRQLIAEADKANAQIAAVLSANARRIKQLHGQMRADAARAGALNEEVMARTALLQVVTIGYDNGVNIITEVLSAEEDLFDAQINLHQAAYGYLNNLVMVKGMLADIDDAFAAQIETHFTADKP